MIDLKGEQAETVKAMTPEQASRHWQVQLHLSDRALKDWHDYAAKLEKRYKAEKDELFRTRRSGKKFAILYSNTETLKSSFYARTPKPDVRRRWLDRSPVARTAADVIERALSYCADNTKHDRVLRAGVHDVALAGRGVAWLKYEAKLEQVPQIDPMTGGPMVGLDGQPVTAEQIVEQDVYEEHVYWCDFRWSPARTWQDVTWIARAHRMSREDLRENQFENADEVPLNWQPKVDGKADDQVPDETKRSEVWEVWCKSSLKRYWIVKGYSKALRIDDDPYELTGFWPIAEPLSAVLGTDSFTPSPFYAQYEDQAEDLDEITGRISMLVKALKRRGIYDASITELRRLAKAADNEFIPVDGQKYALVAQQGGIKNAFQTEDLQPIATVLMGLYEQRERLVQAIYEVSGISDIIRGNSNPNETATAQSIKAQFGSMRLRDQQREVQRWIRDTYRLKAEIICQNFMPEKLAAMTGMNVQDEVFQQAIELLRSDEMRAYQVDIETDSTVFEDAEQEKQSRVELLTAMSGFMQQSLPVVQAAPEMMPLVAEMMAFGVRSFKAGRQLEDKLDETMQALTARLQAPPEPQPDPNAMKIEAEMQRDAQAHEMTMAAKQMDVQAKVIDLQAHQQRTAIDLEKAMAEAAFKRDAMFNGQQAGSPPLQ